MGRSLRTLAGTLLALLLGPGQVVHAQTAAPARRGGFDFEQRRASHWAWQPLCTANPPAPPAGAGPQQPIDAFLDARLAAVGLHRSPPGAPHVLLRRLWFDLVGLPPPPEAITRFVANADDRACEREIDELLASPHFGERWARHWLDLVRYAETLGHEFDYAIPNAWRYRDYVIRAWNCDLPYDQFLREHIAGDLLPAPRRDAEGRNESIQATAAWWFAEQVHSPVDARQHEADRVDNQIDVFGKVMLGLTVACARCHDHKFDAIRSADYYALFGFVASSRYVQAPLQPVDVNGKEYAAALASQRTLASTWAEAKALGSERLPARDPEPAASRPSSLPPGLVMIAAADGPRSDWILTNDGFGAQPWHGAFCPDPAAAEPRLLTLPGAFWNSAVAGPRREGVLQTRTFPLEQRYLHLRVAGRHSRIRLILDGFQLVRDPIYGGLRKAVNEPYAHWITFDAAAWPGRPAYLQCLDQRAPDLADPDYDGRSYPDDAWLAVQMVVQSPHPEPPRVGGMQLPSEAWPNPPEAVQKALAAVHEAGARLPVSATVPSLGDGTGHDQHVFVRGNPRQPGAQAPRRFLEALGGEAASCAGPGSGRLALADAVLAPDNPLPARVIVNRLWHHLFGRGLVRSVDNFGALGCAPSHPELLDWLARDFVAHGWSIKHTLRQIVSSAAWRQDSRERANAAERDPDNVLLHRQNVRRLEAEAVRDSLLAISGRLDPTRFGPGVDLPIEDSQKARGQPKNAGPVDGDGRRSIYLAVRRNFLSPMLLAFDLPTPFATVGARNVSNVPAQALTLANDPFVHAMSEKFAARVIDTAAASVQARLTLAYELAFARPPSAAEQEQCTRFLVTAAAEHATSVDDPRPWTDLLHALTTTNEFTFRR